MNSILNISDFIVKSIDIPVLDVRSPAEYNHGHIPGAVNLPLFSDSERSVIGTLYLQKGSAEATMKGLELIGPRIKELAEYALNLAENKEILLHCWRGGLRSRSMAWLLNTVGIKTYILEGGYKSYRRFAHSYFEKPFKINVIGGMTGSGKTEILESVQSLGQQVIHLEKLANHKGSVFGSIGMKSQPTTEQFENDLFNELYHIQLDKPVYIEDESIAIGKVFIPNVFFQQIANAEIIILDVSEDRRIKHLIQCYTGCDNELLIEAVKKIERRLGLANTKQIILLLQNGEMSSAVKMILQYYDKIYLKSMSLRNRPKSSILSINQESFDQIALKIINESDQK